MVAAIVVLFLLNEIFKKTQANVVVLECTVRYRVVAYYILRDYLLHFISDTAVLTPKHPAIVTGLTGSRKTAAA